MRAYLDSEPNESPDKCRYGVGLGDHVYGWSILVNGGESVGQSEQPKLAVSLAAIKGLAGNLLKIFESSERRLQLLEGCGNPSPSSQSDFVVRNL